MDGSVLCGPTGWSDTFRQDGMIYTHRRRHQAQEITCNSDPTAVLGRGTDSQGCSALLCLGLLHGSVHLGLGRRSRWRAISEEVSFSQCTRGGRCGVTGTWTMQTLMTDQFWSWLCPNEPWAWGKAHAVPEYSHLSNGWWLCWWEGRGGTADVQSSVQALNPCIFVSGSLQEPLTSPRLRTLPHPNVDRWLWPGPGLRAGEFLWLPHPSAQL